VRSRFQFVDDHRDTYEVKRLCQVLDVNRSSYYKWLAGTEARAARQHQDRVLAQEIREVHGESGGAYGSPRVTAELREKGRRVNEKRVARIMRTFSITGIRLRRRVRTTVPDPATSPVADLFQRNFTATEPGLKYMGDITYLPLENGEFLYLATVLDCFSRKVVGWSIASHMRTDLVADALRMAASTRGRLDGAVFHSDHGAQYGSRAFADLCDQLGVTRSLATNRALRRITFSLAMDWPWQDDPLEVRRRGDSPKVVSLSRDVSGVPADTLFTDGQDVELSVEQWNRVIERDLFGLEGDHPGVSGRTLLSFLIRRVSAHGFNEPTRTFSRQAAAEASSNLAYLLGLDWQLVNGYRELNARKATRDQLRKAVNDPVWGRIVGSTADLRGQITLAEAQVERLRAQVAACQVVPEYERLKERADQVSRRIKQLAQDDVIDQHNLEELQGAVTETTDVEVSYLEPAYHELGVILNDQVRRRFEDVKAFHHSVVRNRRRFLEEEIQELTDRLAARRQERADLGEDQARLLRELAEGGALEALTALQTALGREEAALGALRHRFDAAQALEASARQITAKSLELQQAVDLDL
jgi:hypothetical protein